jgi:hypothetical protein
MKSISTLKWYFVDNFTDLLQQDLLLANCMYIERLSKKSKNGDFCNFTCNKINNLQASNLKI